LFKQIKQLLLMVLIANLLCAHCAFASNQADQDFLDAQRAYQSKDLKKLEAIFIKNQNNKNVLNIYPEYWLLLLKLGSVDSSQVQNFINTYSDSRLADRVMTDWLKILGKKQDWNTFSEVIKNYKGNDAGVSCYALQGRFYQNDPLVFKEAKDYWIESFDYPSNCEAVFDLMQNLKVLTEDDLWKRLRLTMDQQQINQARLVIKRLPNVSADLFEAVLKDPQKYVLNRSASVFQTKFERELYLYALNRLLRIRPEAAKQTWGQVSTKFADDEIAFMWRNLAVFAARNHDPLALSIFSNIKNNEMDKEAFAWKVRAAMWAQDWNLVSTTISQMSLDQQAEGVWRYWRARAYKANNDIPKANQLLITLAKENGYYGLLAMDELGDVLQTMPSAYVPNNVEIEQVQSHEGIQRAIELQRLGLKWESRAEWTWATKNYDDKQLLAAAEFALRQSWYDLAINTAERTKSIHNYALRFPAPYRETVTNFSQMQGVDEAWVYGLTRQESRFNQNAKSGVGAAGLMQVMPATATWIAKRIKLGDYRYEKIHQLETNVQLGTYYLRYTLDMMNGQIPLATAAYNAGPGRVKSWSVDKPLEGAIYVENIPLLETRAYVQKVMANTYFYSRLLGTKVQGIKQSLGVVNHPNFRMNE